MAEKKSEVKKEVVEAEAKELKPKPDCPICGGKGFVELAGGSLKVGCTCMFKD